MLLDQKGEILEIRDRLDGALEAYQEAYSIDEALVLEEGTPEAQSAFAKTCSYMGYVYALKGEYQRALSYYEKDLSISNGLNKIMNTSESKRGVLISQNNVSEVLEALKEGDKAKQLRKSSLDIATELYRADSNSRAKDDFAVALVSYGMHLPEEKAGAYIRHAASIWEELYKNDPQPIYRERILFCKRINRGGII
jgi:tetratricopeptide (TPR) repeat protein